MVNIAIFISVPQFAITMHRLKFTLEGKLVTARSEAEVAASSLAVGPELIGFDISGIDGPVSSDPEYLRRLENAVTQEKDRGKLPFEADAYVASLSKAAGRDKHYAWVAVQFYKTE